MIFVSTTFFPDNTDIKKVLETCNENSITSIELGSNHSYNKNYIDIIKNNSFNYLAHNYFFRPKNDFVINIASTDSYILNNSINHIFKSIDVCSMINAKMYTIHPGFLTDAISESKSKSNYDFVWDDKKLLNINYEKCFNTLIGSLEKILNYASKKDVAVSIETEGSTNKKGHLLLQQPDEFLRILKYFNKVDLKFNVNIGHLNLASKVFNFKPKDFIDLIADHIVSFELSHNDGKEDQHLPLIENEWYWNHILDKRFLNCYKILEYRNVEIKIIKESLKMIKEKIEQELV